MFRRIIWWVGLYLETRLWFALRLKHYAFSLFVRFIFVFFFYIYFITMLWRRVLCVAHYTIHSHINVYQFYDTCISLQSLHPHNILFYTIWKLVFLFTYMFYICISCGYPNCFIIYISMAWWFVYFSAECIKYFNNAFWFSVSYAMGISTNKKYKMNEKKDKKN